ncbi:ankyrin repeat domain-containing protein 31 [Peromyscus californicus insignis]|uniref:ankyrin repeat domain-containing protein 31 n=1 Tax=Peromyscus californicus insignis TaxID=564181 RepID=UPI0022A75F7D|nr:ankyrin repeat domain-containing protein 31 [Peromyscus californicus insignis]
MEKGAQASDSDSDETVIEGSVTENEPEEEELPWRRLLMNRYTPTKSEIFLHPGVNGMWKGMPSPEIHLGLKLGKDSQEQKNKNKVMLTLSEDLVLQEPQDEATQNQVLLQTRKKSSAFSVSFPDPEVSWSHQKTGGPEAENCENVPHSEKELSENTDSPETSLLSGTSLMASELVTLKERSLAEPVKTLAVPNTFSEPGKDVTLTMTSKETKDEESSLETFVSALEKLIESPEGTQEETLLEIMNDFDPQELMNPLSNSLSSLSVPLNALSASYRDVLENTKDEAALPAELLATINTLLGADVGPGPVGPICQGKEKSSSASDGNGCLEVQSTMSLIDEDCTQIAQTIEDPKPFRLQTVAHENATSYEQLKNKGNSYPVKQPSVQEPPHVLRRSSRLEKLKASRAVAHTDVVLKTPETILPKPLSYEDQIDSIFATESSSKRKNMHSSRFKSEQIRKNEQLKIKNGKRKMNKLCLSSINRRNIFGENLLYKAALHNDVDLVRCCIENGGNVHQPSYAGWTALHEASLEGHYEIVSELLKGGADVDVKGKYQITPLHDAVMNGHYKVAELLLLNGADPLFTSDHGICALDEAKDSDMEKLLRKYIPKHKKSAQRKNTDPAYVEDIFQYKKPKLSSDNHTKFICDENSNRQEPGHVEMKGSNKLLINETYIYEPCQKNSNTTEFGKNNVHNVKDSRTYVSKNKGQRNTQHTKTQGDDRDCNLSQGIAISSFRRLNKLVTPQQHTIQTLDDLPKGSCELSTPTLATLKNGAVKNSEACVVSKKVNTHTLHLSDSQEMQFLELESIDQTKHASFSELSLYKEIKLPHLTADQQPHTNQESPENNSSDEKGKNLNEWEDSFLSFIKGRFADSDSDCHTSNKSVESQKECVGHCPNEENTANKEGINALQCLSSENYFSQENELTAGTHPQKEAVNDCDLNNPLIYEQHIPNYKQHIYGTSFDHSYAINEHSSVPCIKLPSTQEVSQLTGQVVLLKAFQNNGHREPTPLVNQADTYNVEKKQDTERNYTVKSPNPSSSDSPLHTVVHSQVIEITKAEKRRQDLLGNESGNSTDFHSTDDVNKELASSSPPTQGKEKEIVHKSDEELTNNTSRAERAVRNCKEKKGNVDSEAHMPCDSQEHRKDQNLRKRKISLKTPCSQGLYKSAIKKRNAKGESQLHVASRGGNLSLVKVLIESRADVNLKDNAGWTPLHEASSEGFTDVIIELLKAGANVNCENIDGMLPLHGAAAGNHLKAAEILLEHGANPNQKDQKQRTALEEADDERMKELLKSYGAVETSNGEEMGCAVTVKRPALRPKRCKPCTCDDEKAIDPPSPFHEAKRSEGLPAHQTISAILQDIEEKQENLLKFEIRNSEDAEQYIGKMLEIKEVMDNILAQQKTERDDLAKKYRVSMESFKHGALREQLANLATRQKSLLVVAKKQKKIRLKIQNYRNAIPFSGVSLRKLPCSSDICSEKKSQESPRLENSVHPQAGPLSAVSLASVSPVSRNREETQLSVDIQKDSQDSSICLNAEAMKRGEFPGNEMSSKQSVQDCALDGLLKSRHADGTEKMKLSSQPVAFIPQAGNSQAENSFTETVVKGYGLDSSPAVTGTINISEVTRVFSQSDACPPPVPQNQDLSCCNPKRRNNKTVSPQPSGGASEPLAHRVIAVLDTDTVQQTKPCLKKTASVVSYADSIQNPPSSGSAHPHSIKKPPHHSTAPKKKNVQLKDLILLGKINPGNDILEFKTQETTHKASILLSGKLKVENGQIYQNPVTWLKDLLGGGSYVTWNYAWSKVTYLGKELFKYVSEEVPVPPEPCSTPQQQQPCLPAGTSRKSVQGIPHYLQIKDILSISDQELLPCHVMEQYWKIYVERKTLTF